VADAVEEARLAAQQAARTARRSRYLLRWERLRDAIDALAKAVADTRPPAEGEVDRG
jgi:hypothetical protein